MKKTFSFYVPYFIYLSIIFNLILNYYNIFYLWVLLVSFGIFGMMVNGINKNKNKNKNNLISIYIIMLFVIFFIQLFFVDNELFWKLKSIFQYAVMLIYWSIYFNRFGIFEFKTILIKTIPIVYLVAILSCIQYFFSPNLFGLIDSSGISSVEWAEKLEFEKYHTFFRASSILGSPQVYSLFMSLYIIIIINMPFTKTIIGKFGVLFLIVSGMLAGNKSFFFILIIYFFYRFIFIKKKLKWAVVILGIIFFSVFTMPLNLIEDINIINRVSSIQTMIDEENQDSRLERYYKVIVTANPFIGNGLGTKSDRTNFNFEASESYFLQIYYEAGLLVLFCFLMLMFYSYMSADKRLILDVRILIFSIIFSMVIVHAFESPVFFIFWGIIVSSYFRSKSMIQD